MNPFIQYVGFGIVTAAILAIAAVGFTLQYAVTNVLNLAYGAIMTIGALAAYTVNHAGASIWIALLAGGASSAVISVALSRGVFEPFKRRGLHMFGMVIVTIALDLFISNALLILAGSNPFSYNAQSGQSHHILGMIFTGEQLIVIGIALVAMLGVRAILNWTKLGRAMRATAADENLARACGINTQLVKDAAWLLSGALCGVAGVVLGLSVTGWTVSTGEGLLITVVAAAIVGGIGQPYGAILGALLLGIATSLVGGFFNSSYTDITAFIILVLFLVFRPTGLFSGVVRRRDVVV
ncbi:MAG TPA: branched-chain amino acid ABC transporter permease [Streptosporangiaceae bacterium]|jgi:branched-chain amino acid transport system permease protein/neutral amino acid transport system permease protein|nr:branched-chain amino acid ABC transporter permease [Streptosporangiaceae bacterium]